MNFLVTGGAGFIGSHGCERLLDLGHSVWTLDDLNSFYDPAIKQQNIRDIQSKGKPFEFIQGDLLDLDTLKELFGSVRFDQVIHLAARAGVRPSLQEPALYQRVNVEGTTHLLELAREFHWRRVIGPLARFCDEPRLAPDRDHSRRAVHLQLARSFRMIRWVKRFALRLGVSDARVQQAKEFWLVRTTLTLLNRRAKARARKELSKPV